MKIYTSVGSFNRHIEIHPASIDNLKLDDEKIRSNQILSRKEVKNIHTDSVEVGDTVVIKNRHDKHKANDIFVVTNKDNEKVNIQKIIHPLTMAPAKLMSKSYLTDQKYLRTTHRPEQLYKEYDSDQDEGDQVEFGLFEPLIPNHIICCCGHDPGSRR